ncbi:MAG: hypothetical protein GY928_21015 [Colwellia sp.]|nr:hypothetical protein [Colwellia sp.]
MIICSFMEGQGLLKLPEYEDVQFVEWHSYCGPTVMTKDWFESSHLQPSEDSTFWATMNAWKKNGFKVDDKGYILTGEQ